MRKNRRRVKNIGDNRNFSSTLREKDVKKAFLEELGEKERNLYERIRKSLIPNDYGIAASVVLQPVSRLWQGWISDGSELIFISAHKDIEQAYKDVEELLCLIERDDFSLEDIFRLWQSFSSEDKPSPSALPDHVLEGLLYLIRLIYVLDKEYLVNGDL